MSNGLLPDQDRLNVRPDLGPNCLQRLSLDDTNKQRVRYFKAPIKNQQKIFIVLGEKKKKQKVE